MSVEIPENCPHCGGPMVLFNTTGNPVICVTCGCCWEARYVLTTKGEACLSDDTVFMVSNDNDDPLTAAERLGGEQVKDD